MVDLRDSGALPDNDDVVAGLEDVALDVLSGGDIRVQVDRLDELLDCDYADRPMAALMVGAACHHAHRGDPRADQLVASAWEALLRRQDDKGLGVAANVRANLAIARGDLDAALRWWARSLELLDEECPLTGPALAHQSMEAYQRGDLTEAIERAQAALGRLRVSGDHQAEIVPLTYLALYSVYRGELDRAEAFLAGARQVLADDRSRGNRHDAPLFHAMAGVLASVRGDHDAAEESFSAALREADELNAPWYAVIVRTMRAEFTASAMPQRSLHDALTARRSAVSLGDGWWASLALLAEGNARRELGELSAAVSLYDAACCELTNPLEQARAMLELGTTHVRLGDRAYARSVLLQALAIFERAGASYFESRTCLALVDAERDRGAHWLNRARLAAHTTDAEPATYPFLDAAPGQLSVTVDGTPSVCRNGERVAFITRHAEIAVVLLALSGPEGIDAGKLGAALWPNAPGGRRGPRLRTMLWQIRNSLGPDAWRLVRHNGVVSLDLSGCPAVGAPSAELRRALDDGDIPEAVEVLRRSMA